MTRKLTDAALGLAWTAWAAYEAAYLRRPVAFPLALAVMFAAGGYVLGVAAQG